jgi:hypothetical protein
VIFILCHSLVVRVRLRLAQLKLFLATPDSLRSLLSMYLKNFNASFAGRVRRSPALPFGLCRDEDWRRHPDLNRGSGFCRPTPYHLAMPPLLGYLSAPSQYAIFPQAHSSKSLQQYKLIQQLHFHAQACPPYLEKYLPSVPLP